MQRYVTPPADIRHWNAALESGYLTRPQCRIVQKAIKMTLERENLEERFVTDRYGNFEVRYVRVGH